MGSNQSNLVNDQVNQILDNGTNSASYPAAAAQKINFNQNTDYKNSYVNADTVNGSTSSIAPGTKNYANQPTSSLMNPSSPKPSSTSSVERRRRRRNRNRSRSPSRQSKMAATLGAPTSSAIPPRNLQYSPTSASNNSYNGNTTSSVMPPLNNNVALSPTSASNNSYNGNTTSSVMPPLNNNVALSPTSASNNSYNGNTTSSVMPNTNIASLSATSALNNSDTSPRQNNMPNNLVYSPTSAAPTNVNKIQLGGDPHYGNEWKGGVRMINLESALESSEEPSKHKKAEFNPETFFNQMQTGGILGERKPRKDFKSTKMDKQLGRENNDADDDFDIEEATEKLNLDVDEDEDTEDLKQKVKELRAMVSRSKGKAAKSNKKMRKPKRYVEDRSSEEETENNFTESTGGESNYQNNQNNQNNNSNSVSEYLNSTSSISTSDVRLISMNRRK